MKVLWITNVELPQIAEHYRRMEFRGGWLEQTSLLLSEHDNIELYVLSPSIESYSNIKLGNIYYSSFINEKINDELESLIYNHTFDVIHIWGTEYMHCYDSVMILERMGLLGRVVISIQGLVSKYADAYYEGVPENIVKKSTLYELIKHDNIYDGSVAFRKRGFYEVESLKKVSHCIGRTNWDYDAVLEINPNITYHKCNEILRRPFYEHEWDINKCEEHTISYSQAHYPIKGLHYMIKALNIVKQKYPKVKLRVAGESLYATKSLKEKIKESTYNKYIKGMIEQYGLKNNIEWMGVMNAKKMVEHYLNSYIFVCASTIENSSNSIGEAMLLGLPVIASDVGGVRSLLEDKKEGLLYPRDDINKLAEIIIRIFDNKKQACELASNARLRAQDTHDRNKNTEKLIKIYEDIASYNLFI